MLTNLLYEDGDNMESARQPKYFTIDDIYNLPEGKRAELIDGEIYMMATPSTKHQIMVTELTYQINSYIKQKRGDCRVLPSPFAVFLNADNKTYVEPDISVICDKNKLTDEGCMGAPDWIIEIVSPSSHTMDYMKKLLKYGTAGVREYWIVDPTKERITVYNFENESAEEYTFSDKIKTGIYEDFEIDFGRISFI